MILIEEIKNIKSDKSEWKKFGMVMGTVLTVAGIFLFWKKNDCFGPVLLGAALFFLCGLFRPSLLKLIHKGWMVLSVVMGFLTSRLMMMVIFYAMVTPIALIATLMGKKFLQLKFDKQTKTYWIVREKAERPLSDYEKLF